MIDLASWRATIGLFHFVSSRYSKLARVKAHVVVRKQMSLYTTHQQNEQPADGDSSDSNYDSDTDKLQVFEPRTNVPSSPTKGRETNRYDDAGRQKTIETRGGPKLNRSYLFRVVLLALFSIVCILLVCGDIELNPGPGLRDTPTLQLLNCFKYNDVSGGQHKIFIIDSVAARWRRLGLALNISDYHLDNIEHSNHNVEDRCLAMLGHWLRGTAGDGPVTWERLVEAMEDARCGELVQQVKKALLCTAKSASSLPDHTCIHLPRLHLSDSQAPKPVHSTPHPFTAYRQYLKDLYSTEYPDYTKPQFTRHRPKQIVNLVLVQKEDDEGDNLQQECLLYQLHGNIDLIQQKKTPLTKDQIGILASGSTAHRVLIEGAPGIGKTTFLWQLCHQWAVGELLQQWELVILVQLRDETTRTAQCLFDLLYHPRHKIREAICHEIDEVEGKNVLLIFDGYDELSDDQNNESIFLRIVRRQPRLLRKATVIVSSRPIATKTLPHQFKNSLDQHVEIIGFKKQNIDTYLTSACQDNPDMLRDLKAYISTQPFVSSVLCNPLHCTIVTELYLQYWQRGEKGFAPSTLTQLYEALVLNLLRRQLDRDIDDLSELPSDVSHQLNQLAELAARGIEQRRYVFDNVPISDTLGLMHSVKQLHDCRPKRSTSHSFTHLTLQEFLAARYWSQLSPQQLTKLLQRQDLFPIKEYLKGIHHKMMKESLHMTHWPVLLFLAGLTQFTTIPELIIPWKGQNDESSIARSNSVNKPIKVHPSLCQVLFESQSPQLVSTVFKERRVQPDSHMRVSPLDWFATGYCIGHSDTTSCWSVAFGDYAYTHSPQCLQAFSSGLHYPSANTHNCKSSGLLTELHVYTDRRSRVSPYLETFSSLYPYTQPITILILFGDLYSDDKGVLVLQQLSHYCPHLRELLLPRLHPPYLSLVPQLPQHTLNALTLSLPLTNNDSILGHHLQQCIALKHLILYPVHKETDITPSLTSISPLLVGQIEHLELRMVYINSGCILVLIHSLTSPHSSLHKLMLGSCTISSDYLHQLTTAIVSSNLTHFATDSLHSDVTAAKGLAMALAHSKTLEEVKVMEYPINNDVAQVLAQAMNNSSVKNLVIGHVIEGTVLYSTDKVKIEYSSHY